jgi:hypothetical protein
MLVVHNGSKVFLIIVSIMVAICLVSSNELEATYITKTCKNNYWYVLKIQITSHAHEITSHTHEMDPDLKF